MASLTILHVSKFGLVEEAVLGEPVSTRDFLVVEIKYRKFHLSVGRSSPRKSCIDRLEARMFYRKLLEGWYARPPMTGNIQIFPAMKNQFRAGNSACVADY
jgi:hypothetical protein